MELNIIDLILQEFKPSTEEHERIKLYLETLDLLNDICKQIYI